MAAPGDDAHAEPDDAAHAEPGDAAHAEPDDAAHAEPGDDAHIVAGDDAHARRACLEIRQADPTHCGALIALGALAHAGGYLSAARTAFEQAARYHPDNAAARVGYARMLDEAGESAAARLHYEAALSINPDLPQAHQGLARILAEAGVDAAEHWRRGFAGHAIVRQRYRGREPGIALLLLVAAVGGNVPVKPWIDDQIFAVTAVHADFFGPDDPLPPHTIVVNAIGDADLCGAALAGAERITARSGAPVINRPALVRPTGRKENARRLADIPV